MLVSVSPTERQAVLEFWSGRFGVASNSLRGLQFLIRGRNVWAATDLTGLEEVLAVLKVEAVGLPFLRKRGGTWKPTTASLLFLGDAVVRNVIELSEGALGLFLRGEILSGPFPVERGYVAVRHGGKMLGCGLHGKAGLKSQLPRAWVETLLRGRAHMEEEA